MEAYFVLFFIVLAVIILISGTLIFAHGVIYDSLFGISSPWSLYAKILPEELKKVYDQEFTNQINQFWEVSRKWLRWGIIVFIASFLIIFGPLIGSGYRFLSDWSFLPPLVFYMFISRYLIQKRRYPPEEAAWERVFERLYLNTDLEIPGYEYLNAKQRKYVYSRSIINTLVPDAKHFTEIEDRRIEYPLFRKIAFLQSKTRTLMDDPKGYSRKIKSSLFMEFKILRPYQLSMLALIGLIIGLTGTIIFIVLVFLEINIFGTDPDVLTIGYSGLIILFAFITALSLFNMMEFTDAKMRRFFEAKGISYEKKKEYLPMIDYIENNFPFQQLKLHY